MSPSEECEKDCRRSTYMVQVFDRGWNRVDTLRGKVYSIEVLQGPIARSSGVMLDCESCAVRFTEGRLISDRPILILPDDTVMAGVNLLDSALAARLGPSTPYSLHPDSTVRLPRGPVRFDYSATYKGRPIKATGTIFVADSAGY